METKDEGRILRFPLVIDIRRAGPESVVAVRVSPGQIYAYAKRLILSGVLSL